MLPLKTATSRVGRVLVIPFEAPTLIALLIGWELVGGVVGHARFLSLFTLEHFRCVGGDSVGPAAGDVRAWELGIKNECGSSRPRVQCSVLG